MPQPEIIVLHAGTELSRHTLGPGEYTLGRASSSSISIKVGPVSRQHARILVGADGGVQVEDLASANGTLLDDTPLAVLTPWAPGQTLRIGDVTLHLSAAESAAAENVTVTIDGTHLIRGHLALGPREAQLYAVEKEVARGGMGAVLQARESATRRTVAMKVMLGPSDTKSTLRFIEEAQVTAQLEHPNIVPVHDLGLDEHGQPFYTMKLVAGITLKKVIDLLGQGLPATVAKYPLGTLLTAFQKIGDALAFAHSRGVLHRDLKPANIMLGKFGEVMVMDWGLAKIIGTGRSQPAGDAFDPEVSIVSARRDESTDAFSTRAGAVMGTAAYMSPEQARGEIETLDARSDLFTLGIILYEILTLARPFTGKTSSQLTDAIIDGDFTPPAARVAAQPKAERPKHLPGGVVPASLDAIVRKSLAPDPAARYPSVAALQADLTAYQNGFATSGERAGWSQRALLAIKRNKAASIGAAAVLLVGLVFGSTAVIQGHRATQALADLKKTAPALRQLAESEARFQHFDSALEKLDAALALDPAHLPSYWRRAWLFIGMNRLAEAATATCLAQQNDPAHAELADILPTLEKLAAQPAIDVWPAESSQQLLHHLGKVEASGEIAALADKLKLSAKDKEKLVRKRLDEWLGKEKGTIVITNLGLLRLQIYKLPIDTLEPLRGLPIDELDTSETNITTIEPLRDMRLVFLMIRQTKVADLSPIRGMPLRFIGIDSTRVTDLTPLRGAPLERLECSGQRLVDFSPLLGAPLRAVTMSWNATSNLNFLAGAPVEELFVEHNAISDLSALKGKPLKKLRVTDNNVTDLSPLRGAPIEELSIDQNKHLKDLDALLELPTLERLRISKLGKLLEPLRAHPSLKYIAYDAGPYRPVAEVWKEYDAQQAAGTGK